MSMRRTLKGEKSLGLRHKNERKTRQKNGTKTTTTKNTEYYTFIMLIVRFTLSFLLVAFLDRYEQQRWITRSHTTKYSPQT